MLDAAAKATRLAEIEARIEWMCDNYSGCDWCCGGGDQEMNALQEEKEELLGTETPK